MNTTAIDKTVATVRLNRLLANVPITNVEDENVSVGRMANGNWITIKALR